MNNESNHSTIGVLLDVLRVLDDRLECELVDVRGRRWTLVGELPLATVLPVDPDTLLYDIPAFVACQVRAQRGQVSRVDTGLAGAATVDGETEFDVFTALLVRRTSLSSVV